MVWEDHHWGFGQDWGIYGRRVSTTGVALGGLVLAGALRKLFALAEDYPDLKASDNFLNLQASLNEVEEQISAARRAYNASVKDYNNALEMFPSNLVAGLMRYQQKMFFEIDAREAQPVDVGRLFET